MNPYLVEHLELYHQLSAAQGPDPHAAILPTRGTVTLVRTKAHLGHLLQGTGREQGSRGATAQSISCPAPSSPRILLMGDNR